MAFVYVKGKRDPHRVDRERAWNLRNRWCGTNGERKRDNSEKFDIDTLSGHYGDIRMIDLVDGEKPRINSVDKYELEAEAYAKETLALSLEERAGHLEKFKTTFFMRVDMQREPNEEELALAREAQLEYLRANPESLRFPTEIYENIFPQNVPQP